MKTTHSAAARRHEVLVLGAGYAGLSAAFQLAARSRKRGDLRVTPVNPYHAFTERLRLHMTATGQEAAEMSIPELLDGTGAVFVRGWVTTVDAGARTVRIDDDRGLRYDTLVYGLGSIADTVTVPGVDEHAHTLDGRPATSARRTSGHGSPNRSSPVRTPPTTRRRRTRCPWPCSSSWRR